MIRTLLGTIAITVSLLLGGSGIAGHSPTSAQVGVIAPELSIIKSNSTGGAGTVGTTFTWTITMFNNGNAPAVFPDGSAILEDALPTVGMAYGAPAVGTTLGVTNANNIQCQVLGGVLTCRASGAAVSIAPGGNLAITLPATPSSAGPKINPTGGLCRVDPNDILFEADLIGPRETNNDCSDVVQVSAAAGGGTFIVGKDFTDNPPAFASISLSCTNATIDLSTKLANDFAIAVFNLTNIGPGNVCTATEAAIPGYTQQSTTCVPTPLPAGGTATCGFVNTPAAGPALNADLNLSKSLGASPAQAGQPLTYQLMLTNNGTGAAHNVIVTDPIPANTRFLSATSSMPGFTVTTPAVGDIGNVTFWNPSMASGTTAVLTIVVRVNAGLAVGTSISNTATVTTTSTDPMAGNNTGSVLATVQAATSPVAAPTPTPTSTVTPAPTPVVPLLMPVIPQVFQNPSALGAIQAGNRDNPPRPQQPAAVQPSAGPGGSTAPSPIGITPPRTGDAGLAEGLKLR